MSWKNRGAKKGAGHKREPGPHLAIPLDFLRSNVYARLSRSAKTLLLDLGAQYNLANNGQLRATFKRLKYRGWRSEATLFKARHELEQADVIVETRKGGRPNRASWYALTFFDLDPSPDYDINSKAVVRGAWRMNDGPIAAPATRALLQKRGPCSPDSTKYRSHENAKATESVAIHSSGDAAATTVSEVGSRDLPLSRGTKGG